MLLNSAALVFLGVTIFLEVQRSAEDEHESQSCQINEFLWFQLLVLGSFLFFFAMLKVMRARVN